MATLPVPALRGRPKSAQADRAIIVATLGLLEEQGYAGLTMAGVAERAGVSTATLYRRISSKEELVVGALATLVPDRPPSDTGSLEGDLHETLQRIGEGLTGDRGQLLLGLASEIIRHPALAEAVRARFQRPMQDDVTAMLSRAAERGEIPRPVDTRVTIALIVGPLHYWLLSGETITPAVVDTVLPMVLRGLGAAPAEGTAPSPSRSHC
jgi:AcrR family transcriptional regulator